MLSYAAMSLWTDLLSTAVHAPSPHNVQPWRVRILNQEEADLFIDSSRTLPKEDVTGSFIILTMGMFIEALRLLAENSNYKLEYTTYYEPSWYADEILRTTQQTFLPFARMRLSPGAAGTHEFASDLFLKRRTCRISLKPDPIPNLVVDELKQLAVASDQQFEIITDLLSIERVLEMNTTALFEDLNNPTYHDEIVEWFRFSDETSQATRDGLDYRCMNTSKVSFWLSARLPQLLELPLTSSVLKKVYRSQLGVINTLGLVSGPFWKPEQAFASGSFLMRFWLTLAKHNLYIHPFGNLVTNQTASTWLKNETGLPEIWLVFKLGYSTEPPKSYRRSVEEILLA